MTTNTDVNFAEKDVGKFDLSVSVRRLKGLKCAVKYDRILMKFIATSGTCSYPLKHFNKEKSKLSY